MIVFQELNYDPVKKYWKYNVVYILTKKVIILRKVQEDEDLENEDEVFCFTKE